ncbi:hypothetical protein CRM22_005126 [Opisthorchis felineus]|uniref:Uncharacterized protein n=1 Tax=Opisthorchis felineus TaxID=147828 RepID=A0A4S2LTT7_OPIFE|nr:hypothetical protein CRM22_005126 [Opisthorchis felineus]
MVSYFSERFCLLSLSVCMIITILFLVHAEYLDQRFFSRFRTAGIVQPCDPKNTDLGCPSPELPRNFDAFRRFFIFLAALVLLGSITYAIIRLRQRHLDRKLLQKVNRQIAAGV